ncbi:FAD:protein FMN transferase [Nocardioides sp.]|uniref:FAD:protein FMN transferase n=1 Tax=Nocardioides sp. TaxID=35761 RepID=UPI002ED194E6
MTAVRTHVRLEALGSYLFLAVRRPAGLRAATVLAEAVVADVDATCSRFRSDSDLSRANAAAGRWVAVDPLLVAAVDVACAAAATTGGLVNPLLGRTLVQLGYDRDFRLLPRPVATLLPGDGPAMEAPPLAAWREIRTDPAGAIRLPARSALDLGSTGKAWAADLIGTAIEEELGEPALVSLGGDVRVAAPDGRPWQVAISEAPDGPLQQMVAIEAGGLATSSTRVRRWSHRGVVRHHLLDPRTGGPTSTRWRTVTATGPSCVAANTAATAAVVLGDDAPRWLAEREVAARLVDSAGEVERTGGWPHQAEVAGRWAS